MKIENISIITRILHNAFLITTSTSLPPCYPIMFSLPTTSLFSTSVMLSFQEGYINGIFQYVIFEDWLSWLSIILWRIIQVASCVNSLFLFVAAYNPRQPWNISILLIHPLKGISEFTIFYYYRYSCFKYLCKGFCVNVILHFFGVNSQDCNG